HALQDVHELRQLIEARRAQEAAHPREPLLVRKEPAVRTRLIRHRPELEHFEWPAVSPGPALPEDDRRAHRCADSKRRRAQYGAERDEGDGRRAPIEDLLHQERQPALPGLSFASAHWCRTRSS